MKRLALGAACVAAVFLVPDPTPAMAGSCVMCSGPMSCAGGFCVLHDSDIGCGALRMLCCPGQACGLDATGRPTCESAGTCVVVDGSDAGTDGGAPGTDSATPGSDADVPGTDGGRPGSDAGGPGTDAGGGGGGRGGCRCQLGAISDAPPISTLLLLLPLAAVAGRRRRRR